MLQKRASTDHREALLLDSEIAAKLGGVDKSRMSIVNEALDMRSTTGYDIKKTLKGDECSLLVKRTERFINWVESIINQK